MALAQYFIINGYEVGNSQTGTLQYKSGSHTEVIDGIDTEVEDWTDLGSWTATEGVVNINAISNTIAVDYTIFTPGESYYFRLLDANGTTSSRVVYFTFPAVESDSISFKLSVGDGAEIYLNYSFYDDNGPITTGYTVDWGDGTIDNNYSHTYTSAGEYTITAQVAGVLYVDFGERGVTEFYYCTFHGLLYLGVNSNYLTSFLPAVALPSGIEVLLLNYNNIDSAEIDAIITACNTWGLTNCVISLENQTPPAPPSSASASDLADLEGRNCNVTYDVLGVIQDYTAGISVIDFVNDINDSWNVGFKIAPTSIQVPSGVTVESIDYAVTFWSGGTDSALDNGNSITDYTFSTNSNGAGVYDLDCTYNMSDGSQFQITKLVLVDGSGNILASVEAGGTVVNSVNGLVIDISADITQVGVNYPIIWGAAISGGFVLLPQTGANAVLTLPPTTTILFTVLTLDSTFTNDYTAGGGLVRTKITIS